MYQLIRHLVANSCLTLFATPWTVAHQAPLSMGFFRQEYWSVLLFPPPVDLLDLGIEPVSPASVQFSCSVMSDSLRPHGLQHIWLPCPSPISQAYSNSCPSSQWCHATISSSVSCMGFLYCRWILYPWATREALSTFYLKNQHITAWENINDISMKVKWNGILDTLDILYLRYNLTWR